MSGINPGPPTSKETALRVSVGSVISVAWSPNLLHLGTVVEVTQNADGTEIKAKVNWDDGDETVDSSCIILFGEKAVRFTIEEKPAELAVRLGRKNLLGLFRGPDSSKVFRTGDIRPFGSFALTMGKDYHSTASDGNKLANGERLATALADFPNFMMVSAAAADHNSHERTLPRVLDLVGNVNSTTGSLTDISVCLGLAFKVNKDKKVDGADAVILGTPIAMMTEGGYGNKSLELTLAKTLAAAQRRYGPNDFKDPVISTKMLSVDSNLVMRRIDSIEELTSIAGGKLVEQIKTILISWRMLDGLRDCALFQTRDRTMNNFLALSSPSTWARVLPQSAPNTLGAAILVQCAQSMALTLVSENRRAARTETVHTAAQREARFFTACGDIVQVLEKNASLFGCTEEMDVTSKESIKKRLLSLKPLLPSKTERRLQDEATGLDGGHGPRNASETEDRELAKKKVEKVARPKRGATHGTGNSPMDPKKVAGPKDCESDGDPTSEGVRAGAARLAKLFSSANSESYSTDDSSSTSLAQFAAQSIEIKDLSVQKARLELELSAEKAKLAAEVAAHELTRAELKGLKGATAEGSQSVFDKLVEAEKEVARLREKVRQQKKAIKNAEFAASHNQAMFLAKLQMDADEVQKFMPKQKAESSDED